MAFAFSERALYGTMAVCAWLGSATGEQHGGRHDPGHRFLFL